MKTLNKFMEKVNSELYFGVLEKNISKIKDVIGDMAFRIVNLYAKNCMTELQDALEKYQKLTDSAAGIFETEEEKIAYQLGVLGGTTAAIRQLKDNCDQIKEYQTTHFDTKYQEMIIEQLVDKDYVQHNQLAKNLNMSTSQLSVIMNKLDDGQQNIISMSRVGKFKYYSLTDMGKRYYHSKNKGNFREEISELMQCVLDTRKKQNTVKHFVDKYYNDDLALKQKALEVDGYLYFREFGDSAGFSAVAEEDASYSYRGFPDINSVIYDDSDRFYPDSIEMIPHELKNYAMNEEPCLIGSVGKRCEEVWHE